jgi:translation initiation factor IF-3
VEVAPDANPPVCRIMDYNRFKYETAQRAKESRKKATSTSIKEMKYRPKIGSGDFSTKTRQVSRFLEEGHKVKVTIMFRGREVSHPELGMKILDDLAEQVSSVAKVEAAPKLDGRNMVMVLAPDRRARQAARKAADLALPGGVEPDDTGAAAAGDEEDATITVPATPATTGAGPDGRASARPAPAASGTTGPARTGTASSGSPDAGGSSDTANGAGRPERAPAPKQEPARVGASAPSRPAAEDLAGHSN